MKIIYESLPLDISEIIYEDLKLRVVNSNVSRKDELKCDDVSEEVESETW